MVNLLPSIVVLTGKSREHLVNLPCPFSQNHFLHKQALSAFQSLQKSAVRNGFNLQPASTFRDFQRQQLIWNEKFLGKRKVHDDQGKNIDLSQFSTWKKCQLILRWSALPGASRHHWGTEIDIFDPDLIPKEQSLQLEPWEYEKGGYFFELSEWLQENLNHFDFCLPFLSLPESIKIGKEPWHISYLPIAQQFKQYFNITVLQEAWENEEIYGKEILIEKLPEIFEQHLV
ncbi:LAS superfamily LD-carboxypeptidase LdcB [Bisgaardia hudsonensis]|uniref:LAS superfamily LD-carboxypeptidase LdcB n=1 Tax=Bisgaardia hudsonensis TaxID=109472 RepID=A0A4R2N033_9PAST|nr:M15 family metallopeptidase [Bisgaardia hudsonensis]QLB13331.1 peptidase M15 [Bisgaardia hudsonensis]TCP12731.1 LAS superfamily LD-carboxypeptidase LdcB [Bisgaardia hudsonensis]